MPKNKIPLKEEPEKLTKYKNDKYYFVIENNFIVYVNKNYIDIFRIPKNTKITTEDYHKINKNHYTEKIVSFKNPLNIFFGKDPRQGGKFPYYGNSILIQIKKNTYAVIYNSIFTFTTKYKIIEFFSTVYGHYAYPHAIDEFGNYYELQEKIILQNYKNYIEIITNDPSKYLYKQDIPIQKNLKYKIIQD